MGVLAPQACYQAEVSYSANSPMYYISTGITVTGLEAGRRRLQLGTWRRRFPLNQSLQSTVQRRRIFCLMLRESWLRVHTLRLLIPFVVCRALRVLRSWVRHLFRVTLAGVATDTASKQPGVHRRRGLRHKNSMSGFTTPPGLILLYVTGFCCTYNDVLLLQFQMVWWCIRTLMGTLKHFGASLA